MAGDKAASTAASDGGAAVAASSSGALKRKSKNQMRRERAKQAKVSARESASAEPSASESEAESQVNAFLDSVEPAADDEIELESLEIDPNDPMYAQFKDVIERFQSGQHEHGGLIDSKADVFYDDDNIQDEEEEAATMEQIASKKKLRKLNKMNIAQLKAMAYRPESVEWFDVDATDPLLLVELKALKNVVPIPSHWNLKREYLASKRGMEKRPFELPEFIKATGIMSMRDAFAEDTATLRQKARERVQPKMGRLDIDYQKLHDAFFRFQTKPQMSGYGALYYEGKEFEADITDRKPGQLSRELTNALNIPPGAPPPWLLNMQRYGPPPSYPGLKIPGLNAPLPPGAQWGFHPGGYGKPPVDEYNRPLYGDIFGVLEQAADEIDENIDKSLWGEMQEEEYEDDEEEDDEDERVVGLDDLPEDERPAVYESGMATPSGLSSAVPSGIETPDHIELRKQRAF
ncbi:uncharacterized protein V1510DRAFT_419071 [Dipodascopsis tothii]|uniref:uncharacterized protein n=1 Tax=Dipodascopsis tothii TaxID=44089 RepID=UPI0034CE261B